MKLCRKLNNNELKMGLFEKIGCSGDGQFADVGGFRDYNEVEMLALIC